MTLAWFVTLGTRALITPDEGRYASIALEMARSGDWVTPRLNGLLYFEKPPLQYWIGAIFFKLLGASEFAARLWPALSGLLTVLAVGFTGRRLWGPAAGLRALAVAASTTWIVANAHFLTLDAGLTLFLTLSMCALLLAEWGSGNAATRRSWIWAAWVAMALAVLSKGLVGIVIPGGTLLLVSLWRRDFGLWRRMHWLSGVVIFLAIAAPWFVLASLRNPDFAEFFFIHEHFARYLTQVHHREGAWWYYLPLLVGGLMPWTGALPWLWQRRTAKSPHARLTASDVLIAWALFVLVFFSASGSKLPSYILPMFPALALLIAHRLGTTRVAALRWHLALPVAAWLVVLVVSTRMASFATASTPSEVLAPMAWGMRIGALAFMVAGGLAWYWLGRNRTTAAVLALALGQLVGALSVLQAHNGFGQLKSAAPIAAVLRPLIAPDTPIFSVQSYDQTLPFYLGRSIVLVDYVDEFALGQRVEPDRSIPTIDAFLARWQALPQAAAYLGHDTWQILRDRGVPMRVVFEDARRVMVLRR
ncbi:4-amino-4-deoxy-L-arabinose transferase-like glycosyltransferase [Variovorax ginsengisoli]|uniref:4-amino-4-deoxy-L-arabinose transferase-like glycosyltransferase n=2 Tax=Variovorax ginsengisoli TaxID=363844 RepID=A0ABT9SCK5_9BURK|nr:4-amino-4-deoxy-L-arabinose transferase-like glycosyltransferase [Variovorax ginsengisoli]